MAGAFLPPTIRDEWVSCSNYMKNSITGMRLSTFIRGLVILFFLVVTILFIKAFKVKQKEEIIIDQKPPTIQKSPALEINAFITYYQPTTAQCGNDKNITFSGEIGRLGSCAVSDIMFYKYVNLYDTIEVLEGIFAGKYVVLDRSAQKRANVDVWKPVQYSGEKGAYFSKVRILK